MAKITLPQIQSGFATNTALNEAFNKIGTELQDKVLYRANPGSEPNQMENDLDMNSNDILNVGSLSVQDLTVGGINIDDKLQAAEESAQAAADSAAEAAGYVDELEAGIQDLAEINAHLPAIDEVLTFKTEIIAVAGNETNIDSLATNMGAIQVIGSDLAGTGWGYDLGSITDPSTGSTGATGDGYIVGVYENIEDIQALGPYGPEINIVGDNIASVNIVAANIDTVIDAAEIASTASDDAQAAAAAALVSQNSATASANAAAASVAAIGTAVEDAEAFAEAAEQSAQDAFEYSQVPSSFINRQESILSPTVGSTTLTANYAAGYEDVYKNGVKLVRTQDYTATNGTSVTLTEAVVAGDVFEVITKGGFKGDKGDPGAIGDTFETVSKNIVASDSTLAFDGTGNLTSITYASGVVKTLAYSSVTGNLTSITLSGTTPSGIDLIKSFTYNSNNDLTAINYS